MNRKLICKYISNRISGVLLNKLGVNVDCNYVYIECLKLFNEFLSDEEKDYSTEYLWLLVLDKIVDKYDISYEDAFSCFYDIYSEIDFIKPFCDILLCKNAGKTVKYDSYTDSSYVINNIYDNLCDAFYFSSEDGKIDELQNCGIRTNLLDDDRMDLIKFIDDY